MMAATLDDLSGGRFTLGLGTSTPTLAEQFHDVAFHRPATRLAHTLGQVRTLLHGERITPTGDGRGLRLGVPARPDLPIWVAALGPRAIATGSRAADGWYPALVPRDRIETLRSSAATAAGDPTLIAGPMIAAGNNARRSAEQLVGWYLTGMGPLYADFVASLGYHDEVRRHTGGQPPPGTTAPSTGPATPTRSSSNSPPSAPGTPSPVSSPSGTNAPTSSLCASARTRPKPCSPPSKPPPHPPGSPSPHDHTIEPNG